MRNKLLVGVAALVLVAVVIGVINERRAAQDHARTDANWSLLVPVISPSDHTIGNISAPIQLIVYADFQCAYCGSFFRSTLPQLQARYGKNIVVAYRHLPIVAAENARAEAESSECIYQLGGNTAFWRFANALFAIPKFYKGIDLSLLPDMAVSAGVDRSAYQACMQRGGGNERVQKDMLEGSVAGLTLTPSIVLKSAHRALIVKGDYYSQVAAAIEYLLETNKQIEGTSSPVL